jgi:NitT/TauT family transport system permease protein
MPIGPYVVSYRTVTILSVALFFGGWEVCVYGFAIPRFILPAPHAIFFRLAAELTSSTLWLHIWATCSVALIGLCIALCVGLPVGWITYHSQRFFAMTGWFVVSTQAIPVIAIAPLLFLWVQSEYWSRVLVTVVITFFPLYAATITALQRIPRELREVASLEGYTRLRAVHTYEAALAFPVIVAGLRTSMVLATTGAVVGEYLGGRYGLGALLNVARGLFDTPLMFVAVMVLIVITLGFAAVFRRIERIVMRTLE